MAEELKDLIAAATKARAVLQKVAMERRKLGPIATQAQTSAVELGAAIKAMSK